MAITAKRCACRLVLEQQHKFFRQLARSCYLKVKEEFKNLDYETESEYTFKYSDLQTTLCDPSQLRQKPEVADLKFGHIFTDHMFKVSYHKDLGGWQKPHVGPFENIELHPAAKVLHYAIELFEGMKAYRGADGRIRVFRPDLNMHRMNNSAESAGLPTFDGNELIKCINRLIVVDQEWVPHYESSSLYIRPTLIGTDGTLGVMSSNSALLYTILCPVGHYFGGAVRLFADPAFTRAWPGGCGDRKMGANYGPTIRVNQMAQRHGCQQTLWLYGKEQQITEAGTMNIFLFYVNELGERVLATPPLNGLILPGIIRQSVIEICEEWGDFRIEERPVTMDEMIKLVRKNRLLEMFGTGTACTICPVDSIYYKGQLIRIPTVEQKLPLFVKIRKRLLAIQYGHIEHPWAVPIE
ncbi:branched-chain-amino-acid aminotransferase, cytosolic [Agrilus planipennis]|uniref:Branched-chain-amino-acid aminotransferase n=1 Tax=Agrilus planipennis TaxID=224129 RepID=A0A1W4WQV0_AGRPL|nr:branched-chain-amino-acid aminotransferase, cytosolic [Agrilus planipennis]